VYLNVTHVIRKLITSYIYNLVVSGMEQSGFPETLYLIQTINAILHYFVQD